MRRSKLRWAVCVWIRKLWMVESIEKLRPKCKKGALTGPSQRYLLRNRQVQIRLFWAVYDASGTVPKRRSFAIRTNDWRTRKAGYIGNTEKPSLAKGLDRIERLRCRN